VALTALVIAVRGSGNDGPAAVPRGLVDGAVVAGATDAPVTVPEPSRMIV
jgi:hypothetical protein